MRKIREILRLKWEHGLSARQSAHSLSISHSTVLDLLRRAEQAKLSWPLPEVDDSTLEAKLYPGSTELPRQRPEPDMPFIHRELQRKGVTLQLLWLEYKQAHPDGLQYSQFCDHYRQWCGKLDVVLRLPHRAGQQMQVDFVGPTIPAVDRKTGEVWPAYVFVAVLPASNYTYAKATRSQDLPAWIGGHCGAFEFFGGVPETVVPDNPKAGVTRACRYEPDLNPTYQEMAAYYGTVVIPARPRTPTDKGKVENAVQVVERWILAPMRNRTFFSLSEVQAAIDEALEVLNNKPFQKLESTRRSLYETLDKPALKPLPARRYEFAEWRKAKVNLDYHVEVDHNYYSVPYQLVQETAHVRLSAATVEILHHGKRPRAEAAISLRCSIARLPTRNTSNGRHPAWSTGPSRSAPRLRKWSPTCWGQRSIPSRDTGLVLGLSG